MDVKFALVVIKDISDLFIRLSEDSHYLSDLQYLNPQNSAF